MLQNLDIPVGLAFHRQPRTAMERRPYRLVQLSLQVVCLLAFCCLIAGARSSAGSTRRPPPGAAR